MPEFNGYIFIDPENPMAAWATYRGILYSADTSVAADEYFPSALLAGIIRSANNTRFVNELFLEAIRQSHRLSPVSRLRGLFVFPTKTDAERALGWGEHFKLENLVEARIQARQVSRLDVQWITPLKMDPISGLPIREAVEAYWSGIPMNERPHWELLVHGTATPFGTGVRNRCYQIIADNDPSSLPMLELARIAATLDSDLGRTVPWIQCDKPRQLKLTSLINLKDLADPEFRIKLKAYTGPVNRRDIPIDPLQMHTPKLNWMDCTFNLDLSASNPIQLLQHPQALFW